jgi:hypothetical protein
MKKREAAISGQTLRAEESYGLQKLCFATVMGLVAAIAAAIRRCCIVIFGSYQPDVRRLGDYSPVSYAPPLTNLQAK